jgi:hypothetical protein
MRQTMALSLVEVVLEKTDALRLLEEAYDSHSVAGKGRAAALDAVVEIAREKGFYGSLELALGLLQRSRCFLVEKESAGRWVAVRSAVRQSAALVPVGTERRPTALVPVTAGQPSAPGFLPGSIARG